MTQRSSLLIILCILCACLQGCYSVKKTLGIEREAPDEFAVTPSHQPLDMPPDFRVLPTPKPGSPRPQDVKEMQEKQKKVFGSPTEEGAPRTPGQKALIEMAGADEVSGDIRREIDEESRIERARGKPVLEALGVRRSKEPIINPSEEAIKLQEQGIPNPSQP